eukprot:COSAG04_NODE_171_length_21611_cov_4.302808_8_plen_80_part_00
MSSWPSGRTIPSGRARDRGGAGRSGAQCPWTSIASTSEAAEAATQKVELMPSGGTQQGGAMRDAPPPHSIAGKVKQPGT